jgi:hypothetical protein
LALLLKCRRRHVYGDAATAAPPLAVSVTQVAVVAVPAGRYLSAEQVRELQLETLPEPVSSSAPASVIDLDPVIPSPSGPDD